MATCNECMHRKVCLVALSKNSLTGIFGVRIDMGEKVEESCKDFKRESDFEEIKYGEWVSPTKIDGKYFAVPHCSVCGFVPCDKGKRCPECGAKMKTATDTNVGSKEGGNENDV